ncbi:hypothetical protein CSA17_06610 [bacterium DOLJORAL78_65_58]|nr:MAG: hypothetical protein CSB20_01960 [bacterium DOLZORAL124_64_63]PIE75600.1 MAG: hypothetical protein CSA17_06610 [bacterium DOLJORAL78_65_58]
MGRFRLLLPGLLLVAASMAMAAENGRVVHPQHPDDHAHQSRLVRNSECADCHDCPRPTQEDPCLAPCPRHAHNFHGNRRPDEGPDVVIIDQLAKHYEPVVFAHGLHAGMSEMTGGCANCHHYAKESGEIPPCLECHDADRNKVDLRQPALKGAYHRQCLNCHLDWSHENACSFCHKSHDENTPGATPDATDIVGIPHPRIEATENYFYETGAEEGDIVSFHHLDHVEMFGLGCADCHRGDSCGRCHDQRRKTPRRVDHLVSCCQCHDDKGCGFCHADERRLEFDHAVTGVVFNEDHEDLDCTDCHAEQDFGAPPSCDDCHDDERRYDPAVGFGG